MIRLIAFTALAIFSGIGAWGCQRSEDFPNGSLWDWKGAKEHIISPDEWRAKISEMGPWVRTLRPGPGSPEIIREVADELKMLLGTTQ